MTLLGFLGLQGAFAVAGLALLLAFGLVRRSPREFALALGPAHLVGTVAVGLPAILLLVLGATVRLWLLVVLAVAVAVAGVVLARRPGPPPPAAPPAVARTRPERLVAAAALAITALYLVLGALALTNAPTGWDAAHIWSFKALGLYHFGALTPAVFLDAGQSISHPDYPILRPVLEGAAYSAMGRDDLGLGHLVPWTTWVAGIWTAAWLLRDRRPLVWAPVLLLLALLPGARANMVIGYADATVAVLLGVGVLAGGLWLEGRHRGHLLLAAVALAGAANTKNEGLAGAAIVLVVLAATALVDRRVAGLRSLLPAVAVVVAGVLPWRIWLLANGIEDDATAPLGEALSTAFTGERLERLEYASTEIIRRLAEQPLWYWIPNLFLAVAVIALVFVAGRARLLAAYYLAGALGLLLALTWVYWTSLQPLGFHVDTTVDRTTAGVVLVGGMGLMHLLLLIHDREERSV